MMMLLMTVTHNGIDESLMYDDEDGDIINILAAGAGDRELAGARVYQDWCIRIDVLSSLPVCFSSPTRPRQTS